MKIYLAALCLLGCAAQPPAPTASPAPARASASPGLSASPAATPTPVADASPSAGQVNGKEAVRRTREYLSLGISNEVRCNLLVDHLFEKGRRGLYVHWDSFEDSPGVYEVVFYAEPLASKNTPTPTPTASATPRSNPFVRPPRPKSKGVELSWTYEFKGGTCKPRTPATEALVGLKPSLDSSGLEKALPQAWREAASPPTLVSSPPQQPSIEPHISPPEASETPEPAEAIKLIGFIGEGKERRAVLTYRGESHELKVGEKMGTLRVKEINDEDVLLELGRGEETRLMPGQEWSPGDF